MDISHGFQMYQGSHIKENANFVWKSLMWNMWLVKSSLDSYVSRKKRENRLKTRKLMSNSYFHSSGSEVISDTPSSNSMSSATLDQMFKSVSIAQADIRWIIKVIMSSASFMSCLELNELFKATSGDTVIVSPFELTKMKFLSYVTYGLVLSLKVY